MHLQHSQDNGVTTKNKALFPYNVAKDIPEEFDWKYIYMDHLIPTPLAMVRDTYH